MTDLALHRERPPARAGLGYTAATLVLAVLILVGLVSVVWTPYPSTAIDVGAALQDPSGAHWLGTDPLGRDLLSLLMKGVATSLVVAGVAVFLAAIIGLPLGLLAARWSRFNAAGRGPTALLAVFPPLIAAAILATDFGASAFVSIAAIALGAIVPLAASASASVRSFSSRTYLDAARLAGLTRSEAIRRHVLRQIVRPIVAEAAILLGTGVLWEASLSYLGLGTQAPATSLGLILHDAQSYIAAKPLLAVIPGLTLIAIMVAFGLLARGIARQQEDDPGAA